MTQGGILRRRWFFPLTQPQRATPAPSPHLVVFRASSGFHLCSVLSGCIAHCHRWCPPCLVRRYGVVLVYSEKTLKQKIYYVVHQVFLVLFCFRVYSE